MKTYLLGLFIAVIALSGCNDPSDTDCIYLDERLCDPDFDNSILVGNIPFDMALLTDYDEKVYLEDLTGFRCTNCPRATGVANNLKAEYGDRLIIAAVHCTEQFAAPLTTDPTEPFFLDFRTISGELYFSQFEVQGLPSGVINRLGNDFAPSMPDQFWSDRMAEWMSENNPEVFIAIDQATFNTDSSSVMVDVTVKPLISNTGENYFLNMAILESDIEEAQKTTPPDVLYDYVHQHVFRGNSHGPWGVLGYPGDIILANDEALHFQFSMELSSDWNLANCEIVIHASKESNLEVVQVEEAHLIE